MISIRSIEAFVFRVPVEIPIRTAVGGFDNRPGVFLKIVDADGCCGWGEVFCNFPPCGAEHRARLVETMLKPLLLEKSAFSTPRAVYRHLTEKTEIIAIKSGEFGPFAQTIAGIDIALWDLWAKRHNKPIWKMLNPEGNPFVNAYASGLGPDYPETIALSKQQEGYRSFKLKVGFDPEFDEKNVIALRNALGSDARIMIDANQVWNLEEAKSRAAVFEKYDVYWIEEPIRCNRPLSEWQDLARFSSIPLAAGENLRSHKQFQQAIEGGAIRFLQPDIIKWGGFSDLLPIIEKSDRAGIIYCPHSLAGAVGLMASAHLLAAGRCPGMLEIDANDNPLRTELFDAFPLITDGGVTLPDTPGLGREPDLRAIEKYRVAF